MSCLFGHGTGRRIGKTSASIGASLLFPFLSARECKIWAGFWAGQVCWQSQHEKTCIQSVPESSKTHYSDSPNVKRTCVSPKQISDTLQLSICCCRHHNADVSHPMHWHPEHDFNMKYWNNHCHVMSCMLDGKSRHKMVWTEVKLNCHELEWLQSAWVLVWSHPICTIHEDLSHNDHQIVAKMLVSLAAREKPSNLRSLKDWKFLNWSMLKNSFHRNTSGIRFTARDASWQKEDGTLDDFAMGIPRSWENAAPDQGIFRCRYVIRRNIGSA